MKIQAKIDRHIGGNGNLKAIASVSLDSQFVVKGLRVMDGRKGMFVAPPQASYLDKDGVRKYSDQFFPISNAGKAQLEEAVLAAYRQDLALQNAAAHGRDTVQTQYGNQNQYPAQGSDRNAKYLESFLNNPMYAEMMDAPEDPFPEMSM